MGKTGFGGGKNLDFREIGQNVRLCEAFLHQFQCLQGRFENLKNFDTNGTHPKRRNKN